MATTSRADKFTITSKQVEYYSDFLIDLDKNPLTGYLARVTNEESVKQAVKLLLLTERTERFFQPWMGSKLNGLLFEPNLPTTNIQIDQEVRMTLKNCEPRVKVEDVVVTNGQDRDVNDTYVTVVFSINNIPNKTFTTDVVLNRLR